jgi:hypothetical protein
MKGDWQGWVTVVPIWIHSVPVTPTAGRQNEKMVSPPLLHKAVSIVTATKTRRTRR